jgi:hypothetical protein
VGNRLSANNLTVTFTLNSITPLFINACRSNKNQSIALKVIYQKSFACKFIRVSVKSQIIKYRVGKNRCKLRNVKGLYFEFNNSLVYQLMEF